MSGGERGAKIGGSEGILQGIMKDLVQLVSIRKPDPQLVLMMEALVIIITPTRYFKGPASGRENVLLSLFEI